MSSCHVTRRPFSSGNRSEGPAFGQWKKGTARGFRGLMQIHLSGQNTKGVSMVEGSQVFGGVALKQRTCIPFSLNTYTYSGCLSLWVVAPTLQLACLLTPPTHPPCAVEGLGLSSLGWLGLSKRIVSANWGSHASGLLTGERSAVNSATSSTATNSLSSLWLQCLPVPAGSTPDEGVPGVPRAIYRNTKNSIVLVGSVCSEATVHIWSDSAYTVEGVSSLRAPPTTAMMWQVLSDHLAMSTATVLHKVSSHTTGTERRPMV